MKSMMKTLALAAAVMFATSLKAEDSYLYWMLEPGTTDGFDWDTAKMKVISAANAEDPSAPALGYLTYADTGEVSMEPNLGDDGFITMLSNLGGYGSDAYAYILELYKGSEFAGQSGALAYDPQYMYNGIGSNPGMASFGDFTSIPEPTGGMLMLIGMSVLALRRKRV